MSVTVKMDPIDRDIALFLDHDMGPEAQSKALATFAREQLAEVQKINAAATGSTPPHETFVDGRKGASIETVKPDGTIVFEFELVRDVLEWIGEQLVKTSPVLTGQYARSHVLEVDGVEHDPLKPIPEGRKFVFVNRQPYAAKIEPKRHVKRYRATRGDKRKFETVTRVSAGQSSQAPDGVYQAIAAVASGRFGNIAKIKFIVDYFDHETGVSHPAIVVDLP